MEKADRRVRQAFLWVLAAYAGNYVVAGIAWGLGLIAAALTTAGSGLDWPYALPFFLGVLLCVSAVLAALARWLVPVAWLEVYRPTAPSEDDLLGQLDDVCIYILRTRREGESKARLDSDFVLGAFSPSPPYAHGKGYGPFSHEDARRGFERLRDLGIIERESYDTETSTTRYRWTSLGERVAARL